MSKNRRLPHLHLNQYFAASHVTEKHKVKHLYGVKIRQPLGFWHVFSKDYWSNLWCKYSSFSCSLSHFTTGPKFDKFLFELSVYVRVCTLPNGIWNMPLARCHSLNGISAYRCGFHVEVSTKTILNIYTQKIQEILVQTDNRNINSVTETQEPNRLP